MTADHFIINHLEKTKVVQYLISAFGLTMSNIELLTSALAK
jgi:hypothetical protein